MKPLRLAFVVLLAAAPAFAGDDAPAGDLAKLQGTWKGAYGANKDRPVTLVIKGHSVTVSFTSEQDEPHSAKGELKLDEAAAPKAMDWIKMTREGEDASDILSIYELTGDTLKIRAGHRQGDARPTEFRPDQDTNEDQAVFTRQKAEPAKDVK